MRSYQQVQHQGYTLVLPSQSAEFNKHKEGCFPFTAHHIIERHTAPNALPFERTFTLESAFVMGPL